MMTKNRVVLALVCFTFIMIAALDSVSGILEPPRFIGDASSEQCVSLAPAITEMMYALQLDPLLAGVTRFCDYPPQAQEKKIIGGYYDVSIETITSLSPARIIGAQHHAKTASTLRAFGYDVLLLDTDSPAAIMDSLLSLGALYGHDQIAREVVSKMRRTMSQYQARTKNSAHPNVLIILGTDTPAANATHWYAVGNDPFYTPLLQCAGATNAAAALNTPYPLITPEGMLALNPDVILELVPQEVLGQRDNVSMANAVQSLENITAVKEHKIYTLSDDCLFIPGPRFPEIIEIFYRTIHKSGDMQ